MRVDAPEDRPQEHQCSQSRQTGRRGPCSIPHLQGSHVPVYFLISTQAEQHDWKQKMAGP